MLTPGTRIGPYEVVSPLGEGGMGEVYRARDSKLNRSVAIKVLRPEVADDPDRLFRFSREAQVLASLNHPNIAHLHGLEESDGLRALVMELVEGPTLADRIAQGPIPLDEALPIARQIAEALDVAHQQGIVHRDLKPANIKVKDDGTVKVLDFGLAKAAEPAAAMSSSVSMSPTMAMPGAMTGVGMILGTAAYMSPEQARGRPTDKRSDVWAFGCVLYEMLTGRRAFDGDEPADALAAIIRGEVDWRALPADLPPRIRTLIERCLVKDRAQRLADMSIVRFLLSENAALESGQPAIAPPSSRAHRSLPWMIAAGFVAAAVIVTAGVMSRLSRRDAIADDRPSRLSIVLPAGDEVGALEELPLAVSPDGASVVYVGSRDRTQQLYLRRLAEPDARPIAGTEGAKSPFFSPDGQSIGFFNDAKRRLLRVSVSGTAPEVVANADFARGGWWGTDDMIYFAPTPRAAILRVPASASSGTASPVTQFEAGDVSHRWPQLLPDGKTLIWTAWTGPGADEHRIMQQSLATGEHHLITRGADTVRYVSTGHLVYGHLDDLFLVPWRPGQPDLAGAVPVALPDHARLGSESASGFAVSDTGLLAYLRGSAARRETRLVWADSAGQTTPLPNTKVRDYDSAALSPDDSRAVVAVRDGVVSLWMYDFERQRLTPFVTQGGSSQAPVWSFDGKYIFYRCTRNGFRNICRRAADGTGREDQVTMKADVVQTPTSVSPDNQWLFFVEDGKLWRVRLNGDRAVALFLEPSSGFILSSAVSPDGRWIAYASKNETDQSEIWVRSFPEAGVSYPISRDGGGEPRWSRDGSKLFFTTADKLLSVDVGRGAAFAASTPGVVFTGRYRSSATLSTAYDVAKDGRFLRVQQVEPDRAVTSIDVVLHWFSELRSAATPNGTR